MSAEVIAGQGLGGIVVGSSTVEEVLAAFGRDAKVEDFEGEIWCINYSYDEHGEYAPDREANKVRPDTIKVEFGVAVRLEFGVYQSALAVEGLTSGSTKQEMLARFGTDYRHRPARTSGGLETFNYIRRGVEFSVSESDGTINSWEVYVPDLVNHVSGADALVTAGKGLRGVILGQTGWMDVKARFGDDCLVARAEDGSVTEIDYDEDGADHFRPERPANEDRPSNILIENGVAVAMFIGPDQRSLSLAGGLGRGSSAEEVQAQNGEPEVIAVEEYLDYWHYPSRGISFGVRKPSDQPQREVATFFVYVPGRKPPWPIHEDER